MGAGVGITVDVGIGFGVVAGSDAGAVEVSGISAPGAAAPVDALESSDVSIVDSDEGVSKGVEDDMPSCCASPDEYDV